MVPLNSRLARGGKGVCFVYRNMINYYYNISPENSHSVKVINGKRKRIFHSQPLVQCELEYCAYHFWSAIILRSTRSSLPTHSEDSRQQPPLSSQLLPWKVHFVNFGSI